MLDDFLIWDTELQLLITKKKIKPKTTKQNKAIVDVSHCPKAATSE